MLRFPFLPRILIVWLVGSTAVPSAVLVLTAVRPVFFVG